MTARLVKKVRWPGVVHFVVAPTFRARPERSQRVDILRLCRAESRRYDEFDNPRDFPHNRASRPDQGSILKQS
jgi:hypothetical protein